jgi:hypothetical protein
MPGCFQRKREFAFSFLVIWCITGRNGVMALVCRYLGLSITTYLAMFLQYFLLVKRHSIICRLGLIQSHIIQYQGWATAVLLQGGDFSEYFVVWGKVFPLLWRQGNEPFSGETWVWSSVSLLAFCRRVSGSGGLQFPSESPPLSLLGASCNVWAQGWKHGTGHW